LKKRTTKIASASMQQYRTALAALSTASLSVSNPTTLRDRILVHFRNHQHIHAYEGSRNVAHMRFEAFMDKQSTLANIANTFKALLGTQGVCAWGGARWAVTAKGRTACASAMVHRHLVKQPWAKLNGLSRFPKERETNTSCKCSNCLAMPKMVHPRHQSVYRSRPMIGPLQVGSYRKRERVLEQPEGGGSVYGLYQCQNTKCYRTWNRDRNGASNIGRCFWERAHSYQRHPSLCSAAELRRRQMNDEQKEELMHD